MTSRGYDPQPVSVRVTSDLRERLVAYAREQGVDVSDVVRAAISAYIQPPEPMRLETPSDRELGATYAVVTTPDFLDEVSDRSRRMGYSLGELMRRGAIHLVNEHMPETCVQCGGTKGDRRTYCAPWGHDIQCLHRFHFDDSDAWAIAVGAEGAIPDDGLA